MPRMRRSGNLAGGEGTVQVVKRIVELFAGRMRLSGCVLALAESLVATAVMVVKAVKVECSPSGCLCAAVKCCLAL